MKSPGRKGKKAKDSTLFRTNRRDFIKFSALGAVVAAGSPAMAEKLAQFGENMAAMGKGNSSPGRIAMVHDPAMLGHQATIDKDVVETNVLTGVRVLTGINNTGDAFQSLFSGVTTTSAIAIKVNCIASCCTRWEVVRGIVSGLSQMLGGTYDVSNVTIYDPHNLHSYGYDEAEFTFGGNYPAIVHNNMANGSGYEPYGSYELSQYILDADFLIDVPALKSHSDGNNQITVALKNHYGSCYPQSLCGNIPGMLTLNADVEIKNKTCLVVTDALRATYNGGPSTAPQSWNTFAEGTPNTVFITTDPVTNDYWARDMINAERLNRGYAIKPCPWVEQASAVPYSLGVSNPGLMTVLNYEPDDVGIDDAESSRELYFAPNSPNPFRDKTTMRFQLATPGRASLEIHSVSGRLVRKLGGREYSAGFHEIQWDGRDSSGRAVAAGVYLARLSFAGQVRTRRIVALR